MKTSEGQRLHGVAAVLQSLKTIKELLLPFLVVLVSQGFRGDADREALLWRFGPGVLFLAAAAVWGWLSWVSYRYRVEDGQLKVEHGVWVRTKQYIPIERIQSVDLTESLLHRMFQVVKLQIQTAGGKKPEVVMSAVRREEAERLQALLQVGGRRSAAAAAAAARARPSEGASSGEAPESLGGSPDVSQQPVGPLRHIGAAEPPASSLPAVAAGTAQSPWMASASAVAPDESPESASAGATAGSPPVDAAGAAPAEAQAAPAVSAASASTAAPGPASASASADAPAPAGAPPPWAEPAPAGAPPPWAEPASAGAPSPWAEPAPAGATSPWAEPAPAGATSPSAEPAPAGATSPSAEPAPAGASAPWAEPAPAGAPPPSAEPAPSVQAVYRLPAGRLFLAGLTANNFGVAVSLLVAGLTQADEVFPRLRLFRYVAESSGSRAFLLLAAVVLLLAWMIAVVKSVLTLADFTLTVRGDELLITRGLLERRSVTLPVRRIQAVRIVEEILWQPFGLAAIHVDSAGYGSHKGESTQLFPLMRKHEIETFLRTVCPKLALDPAAVPIRRVSPRARWGYLLPLPLFTAAVTAAVTAWLTPWGWWGVVPTLLFLLLSCLSYRSAGCATSGELLAIRRRWLTRTTVIVPRRRIQYTHVQQNLLQRRSGLSTLVVSVASGTMGSDYRVKGFPLPDANDWVAWTRRRDVTET